MRAVSQSRIKGILRREGVLAVPRPGHTIMSRREYSRTVRPSSRDLLALAVAEEGEEVASGLL